MLEYLEFADNYLEGCLGDPATRWLSHLVNDSFPHIERLCAPMDDGFWAVIERILPVPRGAEPRLHWHSRPVGFLLRDGAYWEGMARGTPNGTPPITSQVLRLAGQRRTMVHPDECHWVRPERHAVLGINVVGRPFVRPMAVVPTEARPALSPERLNQLIRDARTSYGMLNR